MNRPLGHRPESERSDWTEQDILTVDEASGRVDAEIEEAQQALENATDPAERENIERRLRAMQVVKDRYAE
jgi:hypothetical protein